MSPRTPKPTLRSILKSRPRAQAPIFAALGDPTRLKLLVRLADGKPRSIAQLTRRSPLTRQAITKHLGVLHHARLVRSTHRGRETLFALNPQPLTEMQQYLAQLSAQWDHALARLKTFVETT